jgi:hypothetical protein
MLVADVIMWFLLIVGVLLAFPALWLLSRSLYPKQNENIANYLEKGRVKPFFMGVPIAAACFLGVAFFGNQKNPFCDMASILTLVFFLFYSNIGTAGLATMVGRKLPSPADLERPWKCTLRGGIVLELAFLFPVLGWFFLLPASLVIGAGALTSRLIAGRKTRGAFILDKRVAEKPTAADTEKKDADEAVGAAG